MKEHVPVLVPIKPPLGGWYVVIKAIKAHHVRIRICYVIVFEIGPKVRFSNASFG